MNRHEFYDKLKEYNSLQHYGTLGQKWGVRKWQNYDGTFNEAGKERYFGSKKNNNTEEDEKLKKILTRNIGKKYLNELSQEEYNNYKKQYKNYLKLDDDKILEIYREHLKDFLNDKKDEEIARKNHLNAFEWQELKDDANKLLEEKRMKQNGYTKREFTDEEIDDIAKERAESAIREEFAEESVDRFNTKEDYERAYQDYKDNYFKEYYNEEKAQLEREPYEWVKEEDKIGSLKGSKIKSKYQNPDGTLTQAGKEYYWKYKDNEKKLSKKINLEIRNKLKTEIEKENQATNAENKKIFDESAKALGYKNAKTDLSNGAYGDKPVYEKEHNTSEGKIKETVYDMTNFFKDYTEYGTDIPGRTTKLSKEDSKKDFKEVQDMFKDFNNINYMIKDQIADNYDVNINNVNFVPSVGIQTYYYNNKSVQNDNTCMGAYTIETPDGYVENLYVQFRPDGLVRDMEFID